MILQFAAPTFNAQANKAPWEIGEFLFSSNFYWRTLRTKIICTLVTFWILCNGHADSLGVKKQVGQKWPFPVVKGLRRYLIKSWDSIKNFNSVFLEQTFDFIARSTAACAASFLAFTDAADWRWLGPAWLWLGFWAGSRRVLSDNFCPGPALLNL